VHGRIIIVTEIRMDSTKPKSPKPDRAAARGAPQASPGDAPKNSGSVKFDDRGQAIWEWSMATGKFQTASTSTRLKKLTAVELSLVEHEPAPTQAVRVNTTGAKKGYDPYDSGQLSKANKEKPVKKDLRKLGEWIRSKKERGEL
jgi:hypothetical protein